jgi:hypothetical protein
MNSISKEFVSGEKRAYRMALGRVNASALSGFIAGAIVASIIFLTGIAFSTYFFQ